MWGISGLALLTRLNRRWKFTRHPRYTHTFSDDGETPLRAFQRDSHFPVQGHRPAFMFSALVQSHRIAQGQHSKVSGRFRICSLHLPISCPTAEWSGSIFIIITDLAVRRGRVTWSRVMLKQPLLYSSFCPHYLPLTKQLPTPQSQTPGRSHRTSTFSAHTTHLSLRGSPYASPCWTSRCKTHRASQHGETSHLRVPGQEGEDQSQV